MESKHIATVMERLFAREDTYFFVYRHTVFGSYDEESKIFTDIYGNEYNYMMTGNALTMDSPFSVYNIMKVDELKKQEDFKNESLETIASEYYYNMEDRAYIIGYTEDFTPYLVMINLDAIEQEANVVKNGKTETNTASQTNLDKLEKIMLDVVEGKYSEPEMEQIKDQLEDIKDVIENTIGTIDSKIGAVNENKTYREYIDEQLAKQKSVVKPRIPEVRKTKEEEKPKEQESNENPFIFTPTEKPKRIPIEETFKEVTKTVIAQDEPVRRLITELSRKELDPIKKRQGLLLVGDTGTGKTLSMQLLANKMNRKLYIVDTLQLSKAGYTGKDIEQVLWDLYAECGKDINATEQAIVFFDEIDKKGSSKKDDVSGQAVLNILLKFVEGSTYDAARDTKSSTQIVKINTSNMTVVCAGAFTDVLDNVNTNKMGFGRDNTNQKTKLLDTEAFVKHGMMPREFMGRMTIIPFNALTLEDIKRILLTSDESTLKIQQRIFDKIGVKLRFTDGYANRVAEEAYKKKTGARGLDSIVDETTWRAFAEVSDHEGLYSSVTLTEETVDDNKNYQLIKKRQIKNKK